MPRQPFLPTYANTPYSIGYNSIESRPEFAAILGKCISVWAYVENEMGTLLGQFLGTGSEAALEVFLTLRRSSNQREALAAAAKHRLTTNDQMLAFEALMVVYKSLEAQRNDLVHGCFGFATSLPDCIFWIEMKHHVRFMSEAIMRESLRLVTPDEHAILKEHLFVYKKSDFEFIYNQIVELWFTAFNLNCHLRHRNELGAQSLRWLCNSPQIQREISRLKLARENNRPAQRQSPPPEPNGKR